MTEPNSPRNSYNEPIKNRKFNNLIKKNLLLISTLAGVAFGTLFGKYAF